MLSVRPDELAMIDPILASNRNFKTPNMKISIYKNRRGSYKGCYLWCHANLGTCRIIPQFVTSWNYEMTPIEDIRVKFADEEDAPWNK